MKFLRTFLATLAILVALPCAASATAIGIAQAYSTKSNTTCVLAGQPPVGSYVLLFRNVDNATVVPSTMVDSNSVAVPLLGTITVSTVKVFAYGYVVPGPSAPTATYTMNTGSDGHSCIALSNVNAATVGIVGGTTASGTSIATSPIDSIPNGGIALCSQANNGAVTLTAQSVNGGSTTGFGSNSRSGYFQLAGGALANVACTSTIGTTHVISNMMVTMAPTSTVSFVPLQFALCNSNPLNSCALTTNAPSTGDTIAAIYATSVGSVSGVTISDSASNTLTFEGQVCSSGTGSNYCAGFWDYSAVGGTSRTFTLGTSQAAVMGIWELTGVTLADAQYGTNFSNTAVSSLAATNTGISVGDAMLGWAQNISGTCATKTLSFSNGTDVTTSFNFTDYALASSGGSSSLTFACGSGTATNVVAAYANYSSSAPVSGSLPPDPTTMMGYWVEDNLFHAHWYPRGTEPV